MEDVTILLKSPIFWIGLFFGVLGNYFVYYTVPWLDKPLSRISNKWRNRTESKKQKIEERIQQLMFDKEGQEHIYKSTVRMRLNGIQALFLAIILFFSINGLSTNFSIIWLNTIISAVLTIFAIITVFVGVKEGIDALNEENLLAQIRIREMDKLITDLKDGNKQLKSKKKSLTAEKESLLIEIRAKEMAHEIIKSFKDKEPKEKPPEGG